MGALSIMDKEKYRDGYEPFLPNCGVINFNDVKDVKKKVNENTAAIILECIQGEGGIVSVTSEFITILHELREKYNFLIIAFIFAVILNFSAYWFSKDMVLRMYNAQEINPQTSPEIYHTIQELAIRANLPTPEIYFINEVQPNAFATGRDPNNAAIAFTVGILNLLDYEELQAVAAHEISHIRNRDTLISTVAAIIAGSVAALANFALIFGSRDENGRSNIVFGILIAILAPIAA